MIIQLVNVNKSFLVEELLKDVNFIINEGDKVAIVGYNGAGKTTLARLICGELLCDSGKVIVQKNKTMAYLKQNPLITSDKTLYDEIYYSNELIITLKEQIKNILEQINKCNDDNNIKTLNNKLHSLQESFDKLEGYKYDSLVKGVINGLGFGESHINTPVSNLSGGEKTRLALAKELIKNPDILILDEPTNHLDINSLNWLENFLKSYKGTLIIISHDRYFLDTVTTKTIDIDTKKVTVYNTHFSKYIIQKEKIKISQMRRYEANQREIKRQEDVIAKLKSFNRQKSIKRAESREKLLNKMEKVERPYYEDTDMNLKLVPRFESGFNVLDVNNISKSFGDLTLFKDVSFKIHKGDKVALIGNNGSGKSTFFKIINRKLMADSGTFIYGTKVEKAYFDQEHRLLDENCNLIEEISNANKDLTETEIRNILASYLFRGDDVFKKISSLSGGEKSRLTFVKLMLSEANFLLLDEPTNHLDLSSKNILEEGLLGYEGTLFIISHDRYFVNRVCNKILYLNDKTMTLFDGNYSTFVEKGLMNKSMPENVKQNKSSSTKTTWLKQKEQQALIKKKKNDIKKCENSIAKIEEEIEKLDLELTKEEVFTDHIKAGEISTKKEKLEVELEALYEQWEMLHEE